MNLDQSEKSKLKVINRDAIKYIAIIPMLIGHMVGYLLENEILNNNTICSIMSAIALFAPPIFFFSITDGYRFTRSKKKYALRLLVFAVITQIPFALVCNGTLLSIDTILNLNIFFTLLAGLLAIMVWESKAKLIIRIIGIILLDAITVVFMCEWMIFGVPIILGLHIFRDNPKMRFIWFAVCAVIVQFICWGMSIYTFVSPGFIAGTIALFAGYFFRTTFYNGDKGRHPVFAKWFFYTFYPLHLLLAYFLVLILKS